MWLVTISIRVFLSSTFSGMPNSDLLLTYDITERLILSYVSLATHNKHISGDKPMTSLDIPPTKPLSGLHLNGTVTRRFLINYPVDPESLKRCLPPGGEISLSGGYAWVSACFVNIKRMRPSFIPHALGGIEFNYLIHRTRARLPYPDGVKRESVLVLEPNINRKFFSQVGHIAPGVNFISRDISLTRGADAWNITMRAASGGLLFEAGLPRSSFGPRLPDTSKFPSIGEADRFLLGVSYGGEWRPDTGRLRLLAETHDPWKALAGVCHTKCNKFLEKLTGTKGGEADHVITMTGIPHYFAFFGDDVKLQSSEA